MTRRYGERTGSWGRSVVPLAALIAVLLLPGCSEPAEEVPETPAAPAGVEEEAGPAARVADPGSLQEQLADATIAARIRMRLVEDRELRRFDFEPEVSGGRVVLRGEVQTVAQRERAAELAREVEGVASLVNEITSAEPSAGPSASATASVATADAREAAPAEASGASYHTVRSGESLWTIARRYGTTVERLGQLNDLPGGLRPGQRLRVR